MYAKPGLNGNDSKDFVEAGSQIYAIAVEAKQGIHKAMVEILHGRNYQHYEGSEVARNLRLSDIERVDKILHSLTDLENIGLELAREEKRK